MRQEAGDRGRLRGPELAAWSLQPCGREMPWQRLQQDATSVHSGSGSRVPCRPRIILTRGEDGSTRLRDLIQERFNLRAELAGYRAVIEV